jgi:hypothetical protein
MVMAEYENILVGSGAAANRTEKLIIHLSPVEAVSLIQTLTAQLIKIGGGNQSITRYYNQSGSPTDMSPDFYMAPGEEKYFDIFMGSPCRWFFYAVTSATTSMSVGGASSVCQNSITSPGTLDYKSLGFEYIEYLDNGQQITKRQIGKDFIVKCRV